MTAANPPQAALAKSEPKTTHGTISRWLDNEQITRQIVGALAGYMDADTFKAQCALAARDEGLSRCDPVSLFAAFLTCAQMGLLPGRHHGHAYLIPRAGSVDVMPGANGYLHLFRKQRGVKDVQAKLVHKTDEFAYDPDGDTVTHRFDPFDERRAFTALGKDDGGLRGGYLRVVFDDGRVLHHFVSAAKIRRNRECAQSKNVWDRWPAEMALKTVLRDAWARRVVAVDPDLAVRLSTAARADDVALGNDPQRVAVAEPVPMPESPALAVEGRNDSAEASEPEPTNELPLASSKGKPKIARATCPKCGKGHDDPELVSASGCVDCHGNAE